MRAVIKLEMSVGMVVMFTNVDTNVKIVISMLGIIFPFWWELKKVCEFIPFSLTYL